jgi:hypothetical protein
MKNEKWEMENVKLMFRPRKSGWETLAQPA